MSKLSIFNTVFKHEEGTIIYNAFSGGVLKLNSEYSAQFERLENGDTKKVSSELIEGLTDGAMLIDDALNEEHFLKACSLATRFQSNSLSVTIAPTLECNFRCPYCYEKGHRHNIMTSNVEEQVIKSIKKLTQNKDSLGITWYGGEPLLAIDVIERITHAVRMNVAMYDASIVTNGYLLNKEMAKKLFELGITRVQVTLDGPEHIHNKRRILYDGSGTFFQILENISDSCDILKISVRVNVDKENITEVESLLDDFDKYGLKGKISLYIAPVSNINNTCSTHVCFTEKEYAYEQIKFYKKHLNRGYYFMNIPKCNVGLCGAVSETTLLIDPLGDLYKCWDDVGNKNEKVGSLFEEKNSNLSPKLVEWLSYDPFENSKCKNCSIMPICMGGCANVVIKGNEPHCDPLKFNTYDFIDLVRQSKQLQKK